MCVSTETRDRPLTYRLELETLLLRFLFRLCMEFTQENRPQALAFQCPERYIAGIIISLAILRAQLGPCFFFVSCLSPQHRDESGEN
jgi:hypothetical protein